MHALAELLLSTIRKHASIRPGDRLAVAVSGGADSVALLRLLIEVRSELGIVLSVAHVNHKLRGEESDKDALFVAELAENYQLELHTCDAPVDSKSSGIEAAARKLRYNFFRHLCREGRVTKIATAHTLDDQAETVLLRLFRGTGIRGLAGIHPRIVFSEQEKSFGEVVRPLLGFRHSALQQFLRDQNQPWRKDSSNQDVAFTRNRLRHRLLPLIGQEFGDPAIQHLGELAEIARAEEEHWQSGHPEIVIRGGGTAETRQAASLLICDLLGLSLAAQRRLIREWIESNTTDIGISFRLVEDVLDLARGPAGNTLELSRGLSIRRGQHELRLEVRPSSGPDKSGGSNCDYEYVLNVPGVVAIPELSANIEARVIEVSAVPEDGRGQLLNHALVPKELTIRNWRAGDRFWPAHTGSAKKVKELLSDRHATGASKKLWPLAVTESGAIVWMRGFAVPAALAPPNLATQAIWIREIARMM